MINIDDLIGIRYRLCGRDKKGMDCIGLVIEVERRFGHNLPDAQAYRESGALGKFQTLVESTAEQLCIKVVNRPEKEGDIILFENNIGLLHHIAVYMGNGQFIHCNRYGVHIERLSTYIEKIGRVYTWLQ